MPGCGASLCTLSCTMYNHNDAFAVLHNHNHNALHSHQVHALHPIRQYCERHARRRYARRENNMELAQHRVGVGTGAVDFTAVDQGAGNNAAREHQPCVDAVRPRQPHCRCYVPGTTCATSTPSIPRLCMAAVGTGCGYLYVTQPQTLPPAAGWC